MHEWHTKSNTNPLYLINEFIGFEHSVDEGYSTVENVKVTNRMFNNRDDAVSFVTRQSYGGETAYMASYTTKQPRRGYQVAFSNFIERYNEYLKFKRDLTIAYGRKSSKATCPDCGSAISLKYGNRFKSCPVCGSKKIISDSNWKALEAKKRMAERAAEHLSVEAAKNDVMFVCGIEWHC